MDSCPSLRELSAVMDLCDRPGQRTVKLASSTAIDNRGNDAVAIVIDLYFATTDRIRPCATGCAGIIIENLILHRDNVVSAETCN